MIPKDIMNQNFVIAGDDNKSSRELTNIEEMLFFSQNELILHQMW